MVTGITTLPAAPQIASAAVSASAMNPNLNSFLLGTQMFGTIMQSYGAYQQGKMASEAMEYNAEVAERDAAQVEKYKKGEIHKAVTVQRKLLARQIAATAASGRQMSGSPLDVMARSESEALMDQEIIRSNAANAQGRLYGQATLDRSRASQTKQAGQTKAFTNLLIGGTGNYARSNYFKKRGK